MTLYMCKVFDDNLGDWTDIGVFSTCAKAMEYGSLYINNACDGVTIQLIDWDHSTHILTDWYQTPGGRVFTRVVTETELDRGL